MKIVQRNRDKAIGFLFWKEEGEWFIHFENSPQLPSNETMWYGPKEFVVLGSKPSASPIFDIGFKYWCIPPWSKSVAQFEIRGIFPCINTTMYDVKPVDGEIPGFVARSSIWEDEIIMHIESEPELFLQMGTLVNAYKSQVEGYEKAIKEMWDLFKEMERRYNRFDYDIARRVETTMGHVKSWVESKIQQEKNAERRAVEEWRNSEEFRRHQAWLDRGREEQLQMVHYEAEVARGNIIPTFPRSYMARRMELMDIGRARLGV